MPQFTPGSSIIGKNRRKFMDSSQKLEKLRDIAEEDVVRLLAHRAPGEEYKSIHPPLAEMEEPDCAVREMVEPTEGAKAGDRIRYAQFTDSMFFAPATPRIRPMMWYNRHRGIDVGVLSGRTIIEGRERDIEKITKEYMDNETYDTARTGLRGRSVHGHSLRLDPNGIMFDALRRWAYDERSGNVKYVKDMVGGAMDKEVTLGKPLSDDDLRKRTTMFRNAQGGVWMEGDDPEVADVISEIHWNRTCGGFQPFTKRSDIKGNKDVGVKGVKGMKETFVEYLKYLYIMDKIPGKGRDKEVKWRSSGGDTNNKKGDESVDVDESVAQLGKTCWLEDPNNISLSYIHLVVRTVNTKREWSEYPKRLRGIASEFHKDWPYQIGLIGMQEVKEEMKRCPYSPKEDHGTPCFARIMKETYNQNTESRKYEALGIVVGKNWEILSREKFVLGEDSFLKHGPFPSTRLMLGVRVKHRQKGWIFRFYTTHLSHGDQMEQRHEQIDNLISNIESMVYEGELPPIVVGDFNFGPSESTSYKKMNEYFFLANEKAIGCLPNGKPTAIGVDHIWVGRPSKFPKTKGNFIPLRYHTDSKGAGIDLKTFSDHDSPGMSFKIEKL